MNVDTSVRRRIGSRRGHKVNAMTFSIMCKLLMEGTRTCKELAEDTGLHVLTVYDWTREMHRQGIIHICMWEGEGRASMRIFMFGVGKDAARPIKPRKTISADYRARKSAEVLLQRMVGNAQTQTA
ncbi:MAG: hypothetical protein ACR2IX_02930 [Limnohabitans sp.]